MLGKPAAKAAPVATQVIASPDRLGFSRRRTGLGRAVEWKGEDQGENHRTGEPPHHGLAEQDGTTDANPAVSGRVMGVPVARNEESVAVHLHALLPLVSPRRDRRRLSARLLPHVLRRGFRLRDRCGADRSPTAGTLSTGQESNRGGAHGMRLTGEIEPQLKEAHRGACTFLHERSCGPLAMVTTPLRVGRIFTCMVDRPRTRGIRLCRSECPKSVHNGHSPKRAHGRSGILRRRQFGSSMPACRCGIALPRHRRVMPHSGLAATCLAAGAVMATRRRRRPV